MNTLPDKDLEDEEIPAELYGALRLLFDDRDTSHNCAECPICRQYGFTALDSGEGIAYGEGSSS